MSLRRTTRLLPVLYGSCKTTFYPRLSKKRFLTVSSTNLSQIKDEVEAQILPRLKIKQVLPESRLWLNLTFNDGQNFKFLLAWLRDECKCPLCWDAERRFKRSSSWLPDINIQSKSSAVTEEGHLEVIWTNDDHKSVYKSGWLLESGLRMSQKKTLVLPNTKHRPSVIVWDKQKLSERLPRMPYQAFMDYKEQCCNFLHLFYMYGFGILYDTPLEKKSIMDFANRIGYIRESSFGLVSEVTIGPETNLHPAYSGEEIKLHTDLTYRDESPGLLCMHCVKAADPESSLEDAGGETFLADGIQAARWLRKHDPTAYHLLTTIPLPYSYFDPVTGVTYSSYWPVIGLDPLGKIKAIHFSNFARTTLNFAPELTLAIYSALKSFCNRLDNPESKINFFLHPGDLLIMNNRRVLHARSSFDPNKVQRHMRTIYMDLDEVLGTYDALLTDDNKRILQNEPPQINS